MAIINRVDSLDELDAVFERSYRMPLVLFKHSNSCGISAHVLDIVSEIDGEINIVVIQENRGLSKDIVERTGYSHQSPQAFVLVNGKAVYHATHYGIDPDKIGRLINPVIESGQE